MNKLLYRAAFGVGLLAIAGVAAASLRANPLALAMTLLIAAFYLMGALELQRFSQATRQLERALGAIPEPLARLGDWLDTLPPALRSAVAQRIEGGRLALPGPALAPYLAGLLVLLGMLGTFLGMVLTLGGTSLALEGSGDLQAMRGALAAPVKGLGLAFGTSVAGVAASAMLGLMAALCRRQRQQVALALDACAAGPLRPFTHAHQRQQSLQLQQEQAQLLPALSTQLQALMTQMQAQALANDERLLARQERFQTEAAQAYQRLAASVDQSLRQSLADSTRAAAAAIQPVAQATLDGMAQRFDQRSAALVDAVAQSHAALGERLARTAEARDEQRLAAWSAALSGTTAALQQSWQAAGAQALGQHESICRTLEQTAARISAQAETQARSTLAEVGRLAQAASEAPRAAAELVAQLRERLSDSLARDSALLDERSRIMATLNSLLQAVQQNSNEQKTAVEQWLAAGSAQLEQAGARFAERVQADATRIEDAAAQLAGSAVESASLGDAFGQAVLQFGQSSQQLMAHLQRLDETLGKSIARSDDQLAYYVAQAREVIDLSLLSQKQIVDDLQRIAGPRPAPAAAAAPA